jgi:hypothetical protein
VQIAYSKVGVVERVVGERILGGVQDFGPLCIKIASEGILQFLISNVLGDCNPDPVEIANGNQPARDDSPGFIKIDRQAGRYTAHNAGSEIGENPPIHRTKNDKVVPRSNIKYPRQATAAECH